MKSNRETVYGLKKKSFQSRDEKKKNPIGAVELEAIELERFRNENNLGFPLSEMKRMDRKERV